MTSSKITENTEGTVKNTEEHLLFDNHFDSNYLNEDLHERLSELMKAPTSAIERISDEVVDLFSRYSTTTEVVADTSIKEAISEVEAEDADDVEAWDKKAESVILSDSDKPICQPENSVQVDESSVSENICNTDSTLCIALQRVMGLTGIREKFSDVTIVDENNSQKNTQILSPGSKISSPVLMPPLSPTVVPTKKNCSIVSASMVEVGRRNLISKLSQEIGVIHKVGDSNRITPSLKLLKNDLKKPPSCSNSSFSNTTPADYREKTDEDSNMPRDPRLLPISTRNTRSSLLSAITVPATKRVDPRLELSAHKFEKTQDTNSNVIIEPQFTLESSIAPSEDTTSVSIVSKNTSRDCRPYSTRTAPPISATYRVNVKNSKQSLSPSFMSRMKDRNRMRSTSESYSNRFAQNRSNKKHNQNSRQNERGSLDLFDDKNKGPTDLKDMIKEKNEFFSPLAGIYSDVQTPRTGIGYGYQKLKSTFKIPKISRANDSGDKKLNEAKLNKSESFNINVGNELQPISCEEKIERKSCNSSVSSNDEQQKEQLQKKKKNRKKQVKEVELENENLENSSNQKLKTKNVTSSNEDERNEITFTVKKSSDETPIHQKLDKNDTNNVVSNKVDIITIGNNKKEEQRNVKTEDPNNVNASNNKVVSTVADNEGDTINRECRTADHRSKVM